MGFIFAPERKTEAQRRLAGDHVGRRSASCPNALPFAMEPVVYDFAINERGTFAELLRAGHALLPQAYYALTLPALLRAGLHGLPTSRRAEIDRFGAACRVRPELAGMMPTLFDTLLPRAREEAAAGESLAELLAVNGFDRAQHEQVRADFKAARIGLAQNRLPANTVIADVHAGDVFDATGWGLNPDADEQAHRARGAAALRNGELAVVTLAAGAGSRWTQGAGVCKALHPFAKFGGRHRTFIEAHLAKSRRTSREFGAPVPHVFTTSYLTHAPTEEFLQRQNQYGYAPHLHLSPGRAVGWRLIPTVRDLRFAWEEMPQQMLDEQQQKVRASLRAALIGWAESAGQGSDYTDNVPLQCLHPIGHWYEVPNLLRNGLLARLLAERPQLHHLLVHNIDTLGATADPALLGRHIESGAALTFEVIPRRLEDRGGGLARVNGRPRLVEGLAMPREEDEFHLSYYNTLTTWVDIDQFLAAFGLGALTCGTTRRWLTPCGSLPRVCRPT